MILSVAVRSVTLFVMSLVKQSLALAASLALALVLSASLDRSPSKPDRVSMGRWVSDVAPVLARASVGSGCLGDIEVASDVFERVASQVTVADFSHAICCQASASMGFIHSCSAAGNHVFHVAHLISGEEMAESAAWRVVAFSVSDVDARSKLALGDSVGDSVRIEESAAHADDAVAATLFQDRAGPDPARLSVFCLLYIGPEAKEIGLREARGIDGKSRQSTHADNITATQEQHKARRAPCSIS